MNLTYKIKVSPMVQNLFKNLKKKKKFFFNIMGMMGSAGQKWECGPHKHKDLSEKNDNCYIM